MPVLRGLLPDIKDDDQVGSIRNLKDNIVQLREELNYILLHLDDEYGSSGSSSTTRSVWGAINL